jgi:nucleoside 2-deoxyribosyltransferase
MKIYLASEYKRRDELRQYAAEARERGLEVISRWLNETEALDSELADILDETLERYANIDLVDIETADVFVFFSVSPYTLTVRGGSSFEHGFAHARLKPVIVVGPKQNVFHHLRDRVTHFDTWKDALNYLVSRTPVRAGGAFA